MRLCVFEKYATLLRQYISGMSETPNDDFDEIWNGFDLQILEFAKILNFRLRNTKAVVGGTSRLEASPAFEQLAPSFGASWYVLGLKKVAFML